MSEVAKAVEMFRNGCACSQAIFGVYGPPLGVPRELAIRIAAGFAGGMRMGETCGAVTGALMVLGLEAGNTDPQNKAAKDACYDLAAQFARRFTERQGTIICRQLTGFDLNDPESLLQARESGVFEERCPRFVQASAQILEHMLAERP